MGARPWRARPESASGERPGLDGWRLAGTLRRQVLLLLVICQTALAAWSMQSVLPYHGAQPLEMAVLALFVLLFGWVSAGFWTAIMGFFVLLVGGDRHGITRRRPVSGPIDSDARTAIVMPVRNEQVERVFAGLRATYESVRRTGELQHFDFYILSDSGDADARVAELAAWQKLCRDLDASGRIFYRWRRHHIKRKSGNVADFCRRWGAKYRYMVVLDADSVMSGSCLAGLVRLMEANPDAGIIQTAPRAAGRDTLYARLQQFATRVYGPLFTAGLHFWQLGESHYWGHNAIIRVAPFIRHCGIARLPGRGGGRDVLSHDFVEAALMRRAGWGVWIADDIEGSYEEMPPNLVDELTRDRRWCQGNFINLPIALAPGIHPVHRTVFLTGAMAYLSAPLWLIFLLLSTALLAVHALVPPEYFVEPQQLFPVWPQWRPDWALALFGATALLLLLPKILAAVLVLRGARDFGGGWRVFGGLLLECAFSALLAPVRMLFHSQFVAGALLGRMGQWHSPHRQDAETGWGEAVRRHGVHALLGMAWAAAVYWIQPGYLLWLLPIVGPLVLSVPISVWSSRVSWGRRARSAGLLLIPEEHRPPRELRQTWLQARADRAAGLADAVLDPALNALVRGVAAERPRTEAWMRRREAVIEKALDLGCEALTPAEGALLLDDPAALSRLHREVHARVDVHESWREPREPILAQPAVRSKATAEALRPALQMS